MMPVRSFAPGEVSLCCLSLLEALWDKQITLPPICPQCFLNCWFYAVSSWAVCPAISLNGRGLHFLKPSRPSQGWTSWFKIPGFKFGCFSELTKFSTLSFSKANIMELHPPGLWTPWCASPYSALVHTLVSILVEEDHNPRLCLHSCIFFHVASSLPSVVESVLPIFALFPGLFMLIWALSSCIPGQGVLRILNCHLLSQFFFNLSIIDT